MYPFCFLGAQDDDEGCSLSAGVGRVGQGKEEKINLFKNESFSYSL